MKNFYNQKTLIISALIFFSTILFSCKNQQGNQQGKKIDLSLLIQPAGKKVKVFLSTANNTEMLVQQEDIVFAQDYETENRLICIYPEFQYQTILGFGAAFTESSAYNFMQLSPDKQQQVTDLYFGKNGIGFNFCRTQINSSDYSIEDYVYVEENDVELKTFSINREKKNIVPMIKMALKANPDMWLFASPWSPPAWMKDNNSVIRGGKLLSEHYQTWANYFSRYLEEYKKEGINFFGVTIQNEAKAVQTWESCVWSGEEEGKFAANYLRPILDKNGFRDIKIMVWDHNKERVMERARASMSVPGADKAIWGIAHHWYSGDHFDNLRMTHELYPNKVLVATENSGGGSIISASTNWWGSVERYAKETIVNFNNYTSAAVAWNLMLDLEGRPVHNRGTGGSSPILFDQENKDYIVTSTYYTNGHFSKYIKRGAVRIGSSTYNDGIKTAAFLNPDSEIVVVVLNTNNANERSNPATTIRLNNCTADFNLPGKSLVTLIIPPIK